MSTTFRPNSIVALEFTEFNGDSPTIAHLPTGHGTAMVVFPSKRSETDMTEPGWYIVALTFPEGSDVALADPVVSETNVTAAADILAAHLDLGHLRAHMRRRSPPTTATRVAA